MNCITKIVLVGKLMINTTQIVLAHKKDLNLKTPISYKYFRRMSELIGYFSVPISDSFGSYFKHCVYAVMLYKTCISYSDIKILF